MCVLALVSCNGLSQVTASFSLYLKIFVKSTQSISFKPTVAMHSMHVSISYVNVAAVKLTVRSFVALINSS